jgi:hypothetical protein
MQRLPAAKAQFWHRSRFFGRRCADEGKLVSINHLSRRAWRLLSLAAGLYSDVHE